MGSALALTLDQFAIAGALPKLSNLPDDGLSLEGLFFAD